MDIAKRAVQIIAWHAAIPEGAVQVKVQQGWVTLTGTVDSQYQRRYAESAVRKLSGVIEVTNIITLRTSSVAHASDVENRIKDALRRNADLESRAIRVSVKDGSTVTLEGKVHAWNERWLAERAA